MHLKTSVGQIEVLMTVSPAPYSTEPGSHGFESPYFL